MDTIAQKNCTLDNCSAPHYGRGFCTLHYQRWYRTGHTNRIRQSHNATGTRLYRIWVGMIARCKYKSFTGYENYGGRGIKVCDEWINSFESFKNWAYVNGYKDNLTIDRVNNSGDYRPENCKWSTYKQQASNRRLRRDSVILTNKICQVSGCDGKFLAKDMCRKHYLKQYKLNHEMIVE